MELVIRTARDVDTVVLAFYGHLDLTSAAPVEQELCLVQSTETKRIIIDLSGLELIDNAGIHALLQQQQRLLDNGHQLCLLRGPPSVHSVFERSGSLHLFSFEDEVPARNRAGNACVTTVESLESVLNVFQDFDDLGGGSLGLVAWELGVEEGVLAPAWSTAIEQALLEPAGIDMIYGEAMWRITKRGRQARQTSVHHSSDAHPGAPLLPFNLGGGHCRPVIPTAHASGDASTV